MTTTPPTPQLPEPERTPAGPAYQGRLLPRPDDEVVDQGLAFDVTTLLTRRRALRAFGLGAGALALAACGSQVAGSSTGAAGQTGDATAGSAASSAESSAASSAPNSSSPVTTTSGTTTAGTTTAGSSTTLTEIPDETAGPYPGDGSNGPDVLEKSGIVRSDIRSSFGTSTTAATGVPLTFSFTLLDIASGGTPLAGAAVYAWHCDQQGRYSMYSDGVTQESYLRGVQVADSSGTVSFTSIVPGCYAGRWPHIHFEVYPDEASISDATTAISTSQLAIPQDVAAAVYATDGYSASVANLADVSLTDDSVFGDDGGVHQLATVSGDPSGGYRATLTVPIDTRTAPSAGGQGGPPGR